MNPDVLRSTWAQALAVGDPFVEWFYAVLFVEHPELRPLFGANMTEQRAKLADTLDLVVKGADNLEAAVPILQRLGRMHRRFGVRPEHYPAVGAALAATFAHYLGDEWTVEAHETWGQAYSLVAGVMIQAAADAEQAGERAYTDALVLAVTPGQAGVTHVALDSDCGHDWDDTEPVTVRLAEWPGTWRPYIHDGPTLILPAGDRHRSAMLLRAAKAGDHVLVATVEPVDQEDSQ